MININNFCELLEDSCWQPSELIEEQINCLLDLFEKENKVYLGIRYKLEFGEPGSGNEGPDTMMILDNMDDIIYSIRNTKSNLL